MATDLTRRKTGAVVRLKGIGAKALPCEAISWGPSQNAAVPCIYGIVWWKVSCDDGAGDVHVKPEGVVGVALAV